MYDSLISRVVKYGSLAGSLILLFAFISSQFALSYLYEFHFRIYAFLSLSTIISNIILLFFMYQRKNREPETFWFAMFLISLTIWAVAEFFQRLSIMPEGAIFWESFALVGWIILPVTFFMFAVAYTKNSRLLADFSLAPILLFTTLFFLYTAARTDLIVFHDPIKTILRPWGYVTLNGTYFTLVVVWLEMLFLMGMILLARFYLQTHHQIKKKQTRLFIIAVCVPLIGGSITDAILPIYGITLLPTVVVLTSIMAGIIAYGIFRYGLFSFNPVALAPIILQTMNEAVIGVNASFEIEFVNKGAANLLEHQENEMIGLSLLKFVSSNDPKAKIEQQLVQATTLDMPIVKHDGAALTASSKSVPVAISITKITNDRNETDGYIIVLEDITVIKRSYHILEQANAKIENQVKIRTNELAEAQARLLASINSLNLGYIMTNHQPAIVLSNHSAMTILAKAKLIDASTLEQKADRSFNLEDLADRLGQEVKLLAKIRECLSQEKTVKIATNVINNCFLTLTISPILVKKKVIGTVILLQDVSEERMIERAKEELFSIASHELRTPLTVMRGYSALIENRYAKLSTDSTFKTMVAGIHHSSTRLINIVNDFLDTSRLEQKRMIFAPAPFDLIQTVNQVLKEYSTLAKGRNLKLTLRTPDKTLPLAYADQERIKEVLINLLSNAIKFTQKGEVSVSVATNGNQLEVTVTDTGRGIVPENHSLLFRKFQQAGQNTLSRDASQGTGLGLYISKMIIENMGGKIWLAHSEVGKGSTFKFTVNTELSHHKKEPHPKV